MRQITDLPPQAVIDSVSDGVYVTDLDRKILYWNKAAERITGWPASEIVGKACFDNVLCHIDKDGHRLCGDEFCPLHRAIVTGRSSTVASIVFAMNREGRRVPMRVSVAPVVDDTGDVIGGVETFRDASSEIQDVERAKAIQDMSLQQSFPEEPRARFSVHYVPHEVIGGDYYAVRRLDPDRYGFILADVSGHGVPAALYTMYLRSLWESTCHLLAEPPEFAHRINEQFCQLTREDQPFAAAVFGLLDLEQGVVRIVRAGNPYPFVVRADGGWQQLDPPGCPLGVVDDFVYEEAETSFGEGDSLLLYTDGAVEIDQPDGELLGIDGFRQVLSGLGYPNVEGGFEAIERALLTRSNAIRFDDDLTLLEIRRA